MAGRGPAAKVHRESRKAPLRGEWTVLEAGVVPVPGLPEGRDWSAWARAEWEAWWGSPMARMWVESDRGLVDQLLLMVEGFWEKPSASASSEIRVLRDYLGLSAKGRQDRRWMLPEPESGLAVVAQISSRAKPDPRKK
jgi:hypothetical protein